MHRVLEEREKHMLELDKERKRTPDYKLQQFKDLFVIEYDNYLKDGEIFDMFNMLYNFLRETKRMEVPQDMIKAAMEYGKNKVMTDLKNDGSMKSALASVVNDPDNPDVKRYARNYCVQCFFDKITDIKQFVNGFTLQDVV